MKPPIVASLMLVVLAVAWITMLLQTLPLWLDWIRPVDAFVCYLPVFEGWPTLSGGIEAGLLGLLVISLFGFTILIVRNLLRSQATAEKSGKKPKGIAIRVFVSLSLATMILLVMSDQHRFMPWVQQGMILLGGFLLLRQEDFLRLARVSVVSLYFFSAIAKMDYQFSQSLGQQFLQIMGGWLGIDNTQWSPTLLTVLALMMPVFELLVATGLLWSRTRRLAVIFGSIMHFGLFILLGPLGLGNAGSVLTWNLNSILFLWLLFWPPLDRRDNAIADWRIRFVPPQRWPQLFLLFVALFPVLEKFDLMDHWPGWSLYAPQTSRCRIWVHEQGIEEMPDRLQAYFGEPTAVEFQVGESQVVLDRFREFNLSRWSIGEFNAPVYPQDRYQLAVIMEFVETYKLNGQILVQIQSRANPFNGDRTVTRFYDLESMKRESSMYWGNVSAKRW